MMGQKVCEEVRLIIFFSSAAICNQSDPSFCHGDAQLVPQSW